VKKKGEEERRGLESVSSETTSHFDDVYRSCYDDIETWNTFSRNSCSQGIVLIVDSQMEQTQRLLSSFYTLSCSFETKDSQMNLFSWTHDYIIIALNLSPR
jgi:hypothetical protein